MTLDIENNRINIASDGINDKSLRNFLSIQRKMPKHENDQKRKALSKIIKLKVNPHSQKVLEINNSRKFFHNTLKHVFKVIIIIIVW